MECSKDISLITGSVDTSCKHNEATRPRDVATNAPFHLELGRSMGDPQNECFLLENPMKMDHMGVPPFFGNHHLLLVLCIRMLHSYAFLAICDAEPVSNLPCSKCLLTLAHWHWLCVSCVPLKWHTLTTPHKIRVCDAHVSLVFVHPKFIPILGYANPPFLSVLCSKLLRQTGAPNNKQFPSLMVWWAVQTNPAWRFISIYSLPQYRSSEYQCPFISRCCG